MEHDEDGGGQVRREHPGEGEERFDAASGRPHDDNGLPWHLTLLSSPRELDMVGAGRLACLRLR
jgi:hypothetical protein